MSKEQNKCLHEKVCEQCVREEIEKVEKKLQELKSKLPQHNIQIIDNRIRYYPPHIFQNSESSCLC